MARHLMIVQSNVTDGHCEVDFNKWYDEVHVPELLALPGIVAAERFSLGPDLMPGKPRSGWEFLAIYELETDDIDATLKTIVESLPVMTLSRAIDIKGMQAYAYSALGQRKVRP
jgi:hypothetical protein